MDKAPWITYRPELKVLDATVRDGGLINNSRFDDNFVRGVYETCIAAGVDYMEIGYKNSPDVFPKKNYGPWRHCEEEDLRRIVGTNDTNLKLAVMADAGGKCNYKRDILPKKDSVLDLIRVACYVHQIPDAIDMIEYCHELGYETTCNIMAVSIAQEVEVQQAVEEVAKSSADAVVVVDSFGAMYSEQIRTLVNRYMMAIKGTGKIVGIHAHNNQQLAFANTIEAIVCGANFVDATMAGIGRGAGNCSMELLLGFLRNPKFHIRPVWEFLHKVMPTLPEDIEWGPYPEYIISGQMNQHPKDAIQSRASKDSNFLEFYDECIRDM